MFVKSVQNREPIAFRRNVPRKFPRNRPFSSDRISAKFVPKISANFPRNRPFFLEFVSENPAKFNYFPPPTTHPDIVKTKTNKVYKVRQMASVVLMSWMFLVNLMLWNSPLLALSSTYTYITLPILAPLASYLWLSSSTTVNVTVPIFCCGCCFPDSILYCRNM